MLEGKSYAELATIPNLIGVPRYSDLYAEMPAHPQIRYCHCGQPVVNDDGTCECCEELNQ